LVRMRTPGIVDKDARSTVTSLPLQRQCDQIPEAPLGQCVLTWK
jgi:hypothetical protein